MGDFARRNVINKNAPSYWRRHDFSRMRTFPIGQRRRAVRESACALFILLRACEASLINVRHKSCLILHFYYFLMSGQIARVCALLPQSRLSIHTGGEER